MGRRADGTNARAKGKNPRARGTNPRAKGTNPRVLRSRRMTKEATLTTDR